MRRFLLSFLSATIVLGVSVAEYGCLQESNAVQIIERNGAAISKPIPDVTVFVPETPGGGEKSFGDPQVMAILPAVGDLSDFAGFSFRGSSVSDASMGLLKTLTRLRRLDVSYTNVTVAGLLQLQGLPKLRSIVLAPGQLSPAELLRARQALPQVEFTEWPRADAATTQPAT